MPITDQHSEEFLSVAYAYAVAAQSQLNIGHSVKDYGIDLTISHVSTLRNGKRVPTGFDLHFQLKATINSVLKDEYVVYDLEADTYNTLTNWKGASPCYLLLMRLPRSREDRLCIKEDVMLLRDCCYWYYIEPGKKIANVRSKRVKIPRVNQFTPESLTKLMQQHIKGKDDEISR